MAQAILHLVPQGRLAQRALDCLVQLPPAAGAIDPQPRGDVVVDRHRGERRGALEHHPDPAPQLYGVHPLVVDVRSVEQHPSRHPAAFRQLVHPVEAAQEGALPASRRTDDGAHAVLRKHEGDVLDDGPGAVQRREPHGLELQDGVSGRRHGVAGSPSGRRPRGAAPAPSAPARRPTRDGATRRTGPRRTGRSGARGSASAGRRSP